MENSFGKDGNENGTPHRKFRRKQMNALAIQQEIKEFIPRILREDRRSAKIIALHTGATPRAVENWRDGLHEPRLPHLILLARHMPELRAKVLEWLDASTGDSGDDPSKVLNDIQRLLSERVK